MPIIKSQSAKTQTKTTGKKSAVDRIEGINFSEATGIKVNIYGSSGTGKTRLWATFPKPILAIVASGGKKSGELRSINTPENRKVIKQCRISNRDEIRDLIQYQEETDTFQTIVLDHATGLQDITLRDILGIEELPPQSSWGMAKQQDWGQCSLQMKETLRAILSLECNVVIVAQERVFDTTEESEIVMPYVASALSPSVTGWLNPACDYIVQTFKQQKTKSTSITMGQGAQKKTTTQIQKIKGVDYCLRTGPDPTYTTKFRVPPGTVLPDYIVDPDYDKLMELINGGE